MLLDRPGRFLYRHGVNLYSAMRVLCTDYRYIVCTGVALVAILITYVVLERPSILRFFGIIHQSAVVSSPRSASFSR
jgi:hypothetical protein